MCMWLNLETLSIAKSKKMCLMLHHIELILSLCACVRACVLANLYEFQGQDKMWRHEFACLLTDKIYMSTWASLFSKRNETQDQLFFYRKEAKLSSAKGCNLIYARQKFCLMVFYHVSCLLG